MKRILLILLAILMTVSLYACNKTEQEPDTEPDAKVEQPEFDYFELSEFALPKQETDASEAPVTNYVRFDMENGDSFVIQLLPEYAPETVANFQSLVADKFYDGLTFHRIIKGSIIQGGDPNGNGTGSSSNKIKGEFAANDFEQNSLLHERGVISMARGVDYDSASCQFFIVHQAVPSLDGQYAAFGRVVSGIETIDSLTESDVTWQKYSAEKSKPIDPPVISAAYFVEYIGKNQ